MNALELAVLARRLRVAVVVDEATGWDTHAGVRGLLVEAAEAIEALVAERQELVSGWDLPLPALDGPCTSCDAEGCEACHGSGVQPTDAGRQVLGFLRRASWRLASSGASVPAAGSGSVRRS